MTTRPGTNGFMGRLIIINAMCNLALRLLHEGGLTSLLSELRYFY